MKKILWQLHFLHYSLYKFEIKTLPAFNKIFVVPILFVLQLIFGKNKIKIKEALTFSEEVVNKNPVWGAASILAGRHFYALLTLIPLSSIFLYPAFTKNGNDLIITTSLFYALILIIISLVSIHFTFFHKDKYLSYFKEFDALTRKDKNKNAVVSFLLILFFIGWIIGSIALMIHRINH